MNKEIKHQSEPILTIDEAYKIVPNASELPPYLWKFIKKTHSKPNKKEHKTK